MTFLQGLILTLITTIVIFIAILWACVKSGSDYDDVMGYDDAINYEERENDESSKH